MLFKYILGSRPIGTIMSDVELHVNIKRTTNAEVNGNNIDWIKIYSPGDNYWSKTIFDNGIKLTYSNKIYPGALNS